MVALQTALLLATCDEFYTGPHFKVDVLTRRLIEASQIYSPELLQAIQMMLNPQVSLYFATCVVRTAS